MKSPLLIFCVSAASLTFALGIGVANAQYHSNFDNKGNIKPIREWGGNRSNLGNPAPRAEPGNTRTAPSTTRTVTLEDMQEQSARNSRLEREWQEEKIKRYGRYDFVSEADKNGLRVVKLSNKLGGWQEKTKQGCINSAGEVVIPLEYDEVKPSAFGFYEVYAYGRCGVVNKAGKVVVPIEYASVVHGLSSDDEDGLFEMKEYNFISRTALLNRHGRVVSAEEQLSKANFGYKTKGIFSEGLCGVSNAQDKYGFIDQDKKVIVALIYDEVGIYSQGLANVRLGQHWGHSTL